MSNLAVSLILICLLGYSLTMITKESMPVWVPVISVIGMVFALEPRIFILVLAFSAGSWIAFYSLTETDITQEIQNLLFPPEEIMTYPTRCVGAGFSAARKALLATYDTVFVQLAGVPKEPWF